MSTTLDHLRADHIGSLSRPAALLALHKRLDVGDLSLAELGSAEDQAIRDAVAAQEAIGFPIVSDGEFRRRNFQDSFAASVTGYEASAGPGAYAGQIREGMDRQGRVASGLAIPGPAVLTRRATVERLSVTRNLPLDEYRFASQLTQTAVKATLIGPDRVAQRFDWQRSTGVYDGLDDFEAHVASLQHGMVAELADDGCPYVQIDAPGYTAYVDAPSLADMRARGEDTDANLQRSIEADNAVIAGFDNVTFGIHLCRGNGRTIDPKTGKVVPQWHREGPYDEIAERLFTGLHHRRFLLEYDSERAGGFEPLRFIPKDKIVVLGLVTTKSLDIEPEDLLMRRIDEAAKFIPVGQLAISPQCGFASGVGLAIPPDVQWAKLQVLLRVAERVWG